MSLWDSGLCEEGRAWGCHWGFWALSQWIWEILVHVRRAEHGAVTGIFGLFSGGFGRSGLCERAEPENVTGIRGFFPS